MRTLRFAHPIVILLALAALALPQRASAASPRESAAQRMLAGVNAARARHGLWPLRRSPALMRSSRSYGRSLMRRGVFGHSGLARAGRFRRLGEALEFNSGVELRPAMALRLLLGSPAHRNLILSNRMSLVGVGVTRGRFRRSPAVIWVLHFGRR